MENAQRSQKGKCVIGDAHSKLQSQVGWLLDFRPPQLPFSKAVRCGTYISNILFWGDNHGCDFESMGLGTWNLSILPNFMSKSNKEKRKKKVIIKSLCHQNWLWLSEAELYQTEPLREVRSLQLMDTNSCSLKKK